MKFTYTKGVSPYGGKIYALLTQKGSLTAREIANSLNIYPNAVYRIAHYLKDVGMIEVISTTPFTLRALPVNDAQGNYLSFQQTQLRNLLGNLVTQTDSTSKQSDNYQISFIQGREEIFARCAQDLKTAKQRAKFIVLGLPIGVSPELMLEQRNAAKRGVQMQIIAQEYSEENIETLKSWQVQGLDVRHGKLIGFHLLLIDEAISYLMYYEPKDKTKRYAVRIVHQAINKQLQKIFAEQWRKAKLLSSK